MKTSRELLEELLTRQEPLVEQAFLESVADLVDSAQITRLEAAIRAGRIEQALDALNINEAAYDIVFDSVRTAYLDAGRSTAALLSAGRTIGRGARLVVRFNARNIEAERWLNEKSSTLVTRLAETQRQSVRTALTAGLERGDNPRRVALDIVGRVEEGSNRRSGGIIGLTPQQTGFVNNARNELMSGDPAALKKYLTREQRDRRFDRTVQKAIREGRPLTVEQVQKITGRYSDRLLALRGSVIARTEALSAISAAQHEQYRQAIAAGTIPESAVTKTWKDSRDGRVRDSHANLHNQRLPFDGTYRTIKGNSLRFPRDSSLGARGEDVISCRCLVEYRIDFTQL